VVQAAVLFDLPRRTDFGQARLYCVYDAEETIAFMRQLAKTWIAFKILAAGAITLAAGPFYRSLAPDAGAVISGHRAGL